MTLFLQTLDLKKKKTHLVEANKNFSTAESLFLQVLM